MAEKFDFRMAEADNPRDVTLRFIARWLCIQNYTSRTVYVREGATDAPNSANADYEVLSGATVVVPVNSATFCFAMGALPATVSPQPYSQSASRATILLGDETAVVPTASASQLAKPSNYVDRNPISQTISYNAVTNTTFANTVRATYTVPDGKNALLQSTYASISRTASGGSTWTATVFKNGSIIMDRVTLLNSGIVSSSTAGDRLLVAGDTVTLVTASGDIQNTMWLMSAGITEFDA